MNTLAVLRYLLPVMLIVARYLANKSAMDDAEARSLVKGLEDAQKAIDRANAIRNGDRVPTDSDPYNRDNSK